MRERFFSKTKLATEVRPGMSTPCLEWIAGHDRDGYGRCGHDGLRAHRVAWELVHGPIPDGLSVLHKCDNPPCVSVKHLLLGTNSDNRADSVGKGRHAHGDSHGSRTHPECLNPPRGEKHYGAKLNESNVRFIFQLRAHGWSHRRLVNEFGVNQSTISLILARKTWAHVDLEVRP